MRASEEPWPLKRKVAAGIDRRQRAEDCGYLQIGVLGGTAQVQTLLQYEPHSTLQGSSSRQYCTAPWQADSHLTGLCTARQPS